MIRRAKTSDAPQIYPLIHQLQRVVGLAVLSKAAFHDRYHRAMVDPHFQTFVAEESGLIRGLVTIWLRENLAHGGQVALIDELIVDEGCRSQGLGSGLVDRVVAHCADLNCEEMEVTTLRDNMAAQRFYLEHHFVEKGVLLERELGG